MLYRNRLVNSLNWKTKRDIQHNALKCKLCFEKRHLPENEIVSSWEKQNTKGIFSSGGVGSNLQRITVVCTVQVQCQIFSNRIRTQEPA